MTIKDASVLIDYILESGHRLVGKAGKIKDVGVKKLYLTEEDLEIERQMKRIVSQFSEKSSFFAEEENDKFEEQENVWVVDPISGTKLFIEDRPHYAIVASHIHRGQVDFAVVYDPSANNLYTADSSTGAFLNGQKLTRKSTSGDNIIYAPTSKTNHTPESINAVREALTKKYTLVKTQGSYAINYCLVAAGKYDGVVSLTKDSFPEFAGCFIANQAGYKASNIKGEQNIHPNDRIFVCGGDNYDDLLIQTQSALAKSK